MQTVPINPADNELDLYCYETLSDSDYDFVDQEEHCVIDYVEDLKNALTKYVQTTANFRDRRLYADAILLHNMENELRGMLDDLFTHERIRRLNDK